MLGASQLKRRAAATRSAWSWPALEALVACFIGLMVSVIPILTTGMAVLLIPMATETGWSRGDVSGLIADGLVGTALGAPIVGHLIQRFGVKTIVVSAAVAFSLSLFLLSTAPTYAVAGAMVALCGLVGSGLSYYSYLPVLPRYYERHLGLSLGVAMIGYGLGNALVPIVISKFGPAPDWREVYRLFAAIVLIVTLPNALTLLGSGKARTPSGVEPIRNPTGIGTNDFTLPQAITSRVFLQLAVCFFLATAVITGASLHLTALLTDRGLSPQRADEIFALYSLGLAGTRFLGGVLLDFFDARWVGAATFIGAGLGTAVLAGGANGPLMILSVLLISAATGIDGNLLPYMTRRYFGLRSYSSIYGALGLAYALGPPTGALLFGVSYDHFGGYRQILWATTLVIFFSAALLLCLGRPGSDARSMAQKGMSLPAPSTDQSP